jgi:hypothetical protein
MKKITVFLSDHELSALYAIAARTGLKFADVLRRVVDQGLEASEASHWVQRWPAAVATKDAVCPD